MKSKIKFYKNYIIENYFKSIKKNRREQMNIDLKQYKKKYAKLHKIKVSAHSNL